MLSITIEVIGIYILLFSDSMRISPGNRPNQFNSPGAKCSIAPIAIKMNPAIIIQRPILLYRR